MAHVVTAWELLDGHSVLDIECLDRVYLNAYVPVLQSSGQVVVFMTQHLGKPIPSPALIEHIGTRFRQAVESYASSTGIPWVKFGRDDRKMDVMQPHLAAQAATGKSGVAAVGVSQEFQRVSRRARAFFEALIAGNLDLPALPGRASGQGPSQQQAHTGSRARLPGNRPREPSLRADRAPVRGRGRAEGPALRFGDPRVTALAGAHPEARDQGSLDAGQP